MRTLTTLVLGLAVLVLFLVQAIVAPRATEEEAAPIARAEEPREFFRDFGRPGGAIDAQARWRWSEREQLWFPMENVLHFEVLSGEVELAYEREIALLRPSRGPIEVGILFHTAEYTILTLPKVGEIASLDGMLILNATGRETLACLGAEPALSADSQSIAVPMGAVLAFGPRGSRWGGLDVCAASGSGARKLAPAGRGEAELALYNALGVPLLERSFAASESGALQLVSSDFGLALRVD
jgi:hypothetical protein